MILWFSCSRVSLTCPTAYCAFVSESCHIDITCRLTTNNAAELIDVSAEQTNHLYNLYSSYQQENPGLGLTPPDGE
jgi:hypothetical protein